MPTAPASISWETARGSVLEDDRSQIGAILALRFETRIESRYGWRGNEGSSPMDRIQMFAGGRSSLTPDEEVGSERALHQHADLTNLFALQAVLQAWMATVPERQ